MKIDKYFLNNRFLEFYNVLISENKIKNKGDLALKMGINQSSISEILSKRQGVTVEFIQNFCTLFKDYTPNDFFNEEKSSIFDNYKKIPIAKRALDVKEGIPLITTDAMAGYFKGDDQVLEFECERFVVPIFKEAEFLISVRGSSMNPKYNSGDIVACKKLTIDTFFQWNKVYVLDTDQGALIKRVEQGSSEDTLLIVSDNSKYKPFELHKKHIYGIALVVGVIRLE